MILSCILMIFFVNFPEALLLSMRFFNLAFLLGCRIPFYPASECGHETNFDY